MMVFPRGFDTFDIHNRCHVELHGRVPHRRYGPYISQVVNNSLAFTRQVVPLILRIHSLSAIFLPIPSLLFLLTNTVYVY